MDNLVDTSGTKSGFVSMSQQHQLGCLFRVHLWPIPGLSIVRPRDIFFFTEQFASVMLIGVLVLQHDVSALLLHFPGGCDCVLVYQESTNFELLPIQCIRDASLSSCTLLQPILFFTSITNILRWIVTLFVSRFYPMRFVCISSVQTIGLLAYLTKCLVMIFFIDHYASLVFHSSTL